LAITSATAHVLSSLLLTPSLTSACFVTSALCNIVWVVSQVSDPIVCVVFQVSDPIVWVVLQVSDPIELRALECQINEFGQTPAQLFR
jgi:hypothetical protein